jgi:hypothetical protein
MRNESRVSQRGGTYVIKKIATRLLSNEFRITQVALTFSVDIPNISPQVP